MMRSQKALVRHALWTVNEIPGPRVTLRQCNVLSWNNHHPIQLTSVEEATLNLNADNIGLYKDIMILFKRKSNLGVPMKLCPQNSESEGEEISCKTIIQTRCTQRLYAS